MKNMEVELSNDEEIALSATLVDPKFDIDFSQLRNKDDDDIGNEIEHIRNEDDELCVENKQPCVAVYEDISEESDDIKEAPKIYDKELIVEDDFQAVNKDLNCTTCDVDLNKKMLAMEETLDAEMDINEITADVLSPNVEKYKFVEGDIQAGTLARDAKIILRSNSECVGVEVIGQHHKESDYEHEESTLSKFETKKNDVKEEPRKNSSTAAGNSETTMPFIHNDNGSSNNPKSTSNDNSPLTNSIKTNSPRNLSPLVRKKAIRLPTGKRHTKTVFYEDVLSAYDIIDRTDVKTIDKSRNSLSWRQSIFSLSNIKSRFRHLLPGTEGEKHRPGSSTSQVISENPSCKVVTVSVQETKDGEPMQVITLSSTDPNLLKSNQYQKPDSSMIIYVDEVSNNGNDQVDGGDEEFSDAESYQSSICLVDEQNLDEMDNFNKKGLYIINDEPKESELPKSNNSKAPNRTSQSFGGIDRAQPKINRTSRRTTFDGSEFKALANEANLLKSAVPFDTKWLKKKTLPNEPIYLLTDGYPTQLPSFPSDRRSLIALEIYTTERTFVRQLEIVVKHFKTRIQLSGILDLKEVKLIFSNVDSILELNRGVLDEIFDRLSNWSDEQRVADVFLSHKTDFKIYSVYCKDYDSGDAFLKQRIKKKKDLETLLNSCYSNPICMPGLTLPSYLITVIQRTPRYILLLKDLLKRTPEDHPDYQNLVEAVSVMEKLAAYINDQLKQAQCQKALEVLETQISGLKAYYIPERSLVHEGRVCLLTSKKTYQCILFNDLLVFAVKGNKQSIVELALELKSVWFEDLQGLDPQTTKNDAIGIYTPDRPYTMYVGSSGEKKIWLRHLQLAITECLFEEDTSTDADIEKRQSSFTYKDGSVYSGTYLNSKRHDEGTMMWPNQMTYRGNWEDDERNGFGVLDYVTGEVYEGLWRDHRQNGLGTFKYTNGDSLSGDWKNGLRHGRLFINYKNGDKFVGQWIHDRIEGEGELECVNGLRYEGQWRKNLKHGKGKLRMPDGAVYNGDFLRGKFHGYGELTYCDGSIYKGEFERGERCGVGSYTVPNGSSYEGQWMHDLKDGCGVMVYENGDQYNGTWVQDMRIGQGVMVYNFGGCYRGQWLGDLMHGSGICEFKDGSIYNGDWAQNKMNGSGTMKCKNGNMFKGCWVDNCPDGTGILTKPSGWTCDGNWMQGKQHGHCILRDPVNDYMYNGDWSNGCKEGKGLEKTRLEVYDGEFINDLRDGYGITSLEDGTVFEGQWQRGQKHGKQLKKLTNGLWERQVWEHGCLVYSPVLLAQREMPHIQRWM